MKKMPIPMPIREWSASIISLVRIGENVGLTLDKMGAAVSARPGTLKLWGYYTQSGRGVRLPNGGYRRRMQILADLSTIVAKECRKLNRSVP